MARRMLGVLAVAMIVLSCACMTGYASDAHVTPASSTRTEQPPNFPPPPPLP